MIDIATVVLVHARDSACNTWGDHESGASGASRPVASSRVKAEFGLQMDSSRHSGDAEMTVSL